MRSWFLGVTNSVDFSVLRKVISTLEDFWLYFTMNEGDNLS